MRLGAPEERAAAAAELARAAGAERLVLLVRDPQLGVMLPAPGLERTLRGGARWRELVERCGTSGRHAVDVDLDGAHASAAALSDGNLAAVFVGGDVSAAALDEIEALLPLLAAALNAEQQLAFARAEAAEAKRAAGRAETLARALDAARADHARLNAELTAEHRRKDEFLAMLAHELRNPLAPLVNAVELLRRKALDASGEERMLEIAGRQLNQLIRLVDDLLDVSRVSRGRIDLRSDHERLGDILEHALEAARPALEARRHEVSLTLPPETLWVYADGPRVSQVFANLLHNAAKYTDPGGRVAVRAWREGDEGVVAVEDNGIGISPEMLPKVFDLFVQAPASLARAHGGLGLGLTLVRSLVEAHGGRVSGESAGLGKGSRFLVRLPLASAPAPSSLPRAGELRVDAPRRLRILVVDDNRDAADAMVMMLKSTPHQVERAYSSAGALQLAGDFDPELVFLDLGLPQMDGFEVLARLRRLLPQHVRFVALTGYGAEEDKRRTREAGFAEHLVKPVAFEELYAVVQRAAAARALAA